MKAPAIKRRERSMVIVKSPWINSKHLAELRTAVFHIQRCFLVSADVWAESLFAFPTGNRGLAPPYETAPWRQLRPPSVTAPGPGKSGRTESRSLRPLPPPRSTAWDGIAPHQRLQRHSPGTYLANDGV